MKISKIAAGLMVILTLGTGSVFAQWWSGAGTGTDTCVKVEGSEEPSFSPFAEWTGVASGNGSYGGGWTDPATGQAGAFWGQWRLESPPYQWPRLFEASGTWYRYNVGLEQMGTFHIIFDVDETGYAYGDWQTFSNYGWRGNGELTGDDPNIPPPPDK